MKKEYDVIIPRYSGLLGFGKWDIRFVPYVWFDIIVFQTELIRNERFVGPKWVENQ